MEPAAIDAADDPVARLREQGRDYTENFPVVPNEYTSWLDEQRAITETCTLANLTHHMTSLRVSGPDATRLLAGLSVNDFDAFPVGRAKQIVMCSPDGHLIGDGPLLRLGNDEYYGPGVLSANWVRYAVETGDHDVEVATEPRTSALEGNPAMFVYQVQGPAARDVLEQVAAPSLFDVGFYEFKTVSLGGHEAIALGHGMSTETGFEFIGPFEHADAVEAAILDAGRDHGLRRLGSRAYHTLSVKLGWVPPGVPPIYGDGAMAHYRDWLPADSREATYSIDGSFDSADIADYYMDPVALGYGPLVDLDHEFVGRDALEARVGAPTRQLVSLRWNAEDVVDVYASLFRDGETYKVMGLPRIGWARTNYDAVHVEGDLVGISHSRAYQADVRTVVSLCCLDLDHAEPGTEVTVVWGEPPGSPNPKAERHVQTEIRATVGPVPYAADRRKAR